MFCDCTPQGHCQDSLSKGAWLYIFKGYTTFSQNLPHLINILVSRFTFWLQVRSSCNMSLQYQPFQKLLPEWVHTVLHTHSRSIWILWYDLRVFWPTKNDLKSYANLLGFKLQTDMNCIFQMRYCGLLWPNSLRNYSWSKLAVPKFISVSRYEQRFFANL